MNTEIDYQLVLAPFQKQTQVEFTNIKLKQEAVRFLTVINPQDKPRQVINHTFINILLNSSKFV